MTDYRYDPELSQAITIWKSGNPIPLDLAVKLMSSGYDVATLEKEYRE